MSLRSAVLFEPTGKATPFFLAQWRNRGPLAPIQSAAVLVDREGRATPGFRALWKAAFPVRLALPLQRIANPDGTGRDIFWQVFQ